MSFRSLLESLVICVHGVRRRFSSEQCDECIAFIARASESDITILHLHFAMMIIEIHLVVANVKISSFPTHQSFVIGAVLIKLDRTTFVILEGNVELRVYHCLVSCLSASGKHHHVAAAS